jgi:hypothetical protein
MRRLDQPCGLAAVEYLFIGSRSALAIYTVALLRESDQNLTGLHIPDRSRAYMIYPAAAIRLRIIHAKPWKDGKGSLNVGEMEDDCSIEYGFHRVTRHSMYTSSQGGMATITYRPSFADGPREPE